MPLDDSPKTFYFKDFSLPKTLKVYHKPAKKGKNRTFCHQFVDSLTRPWGVEGERPRTAPNRHLARVKGERSPWPAPIYLKEGNPKGAVVGRRRDGDPCSDVFDLASVTSANGLAVLPGISGGPGRLGQPNSPHRAPAIDREIGGPKQIPYLLREMREGRELSRPSFEIDLSPRPESRSARPMIFPLLDDGDRHLSAVSATVSMGRGESLFGGAR